MAVKIVVFGAQQICRDFIRYLHDQPGVEICLIVTSERPRDARYGYPSVSDEAVQHGYRVESWPRIDASALAEVASLQPDAIFSVYARHIFPEALIRIPRLGAFNVHPSLLPDYRGPAPAAWAILNGEQTTGVTIHVVDKGIDTGDVLIQQEVPIAEEETGFELHQRLMTVGTRLLAEHFWRIMSADLAPRKQVGPGSYFGEFAARGRIDWQRDAEAIRNIIRVHAAPFDSARAVMSGKTLLINKASVMRGDRYPAQGPGRILDLRDGRPVVSCGRGVLLLEDYEVMPPSHASERDQLLKVGNRFTVHT
jgi:methionyl-tRNA formyltransferase